MHSISLLRQGFCFFHNFFFGSANQQPVKNYVCLTFLIQNNKHHVTNKIHCNNNIMTIVKKKIYYRSRELIKYRKHLIILCPGLHQTIVNSYVVNNINVHVCQHVYVNINVHA